MKPSDYYLNLAAPLVDMDVSRDGKVPRNRPGEAPASGPTNDLQRWWGQQAQKHSGGFPVAARGLAQAEARALQNGNVNPNRFKKAPSTQAARLLTVLVEFNPNANDDFTGFERSRHPQHAGRGLRYGAGGHAAQRATAQRPPNPATRGATPDNNTIWVADFNPHTTTSCCSRTTGITERVRKDLTGPDGNPGIGMQRFHPSQHVPRDVEGRLRR